MTSTKVLWFVVSALLAAQIITQASEQTALVRSCRSGPWSDPTTWEGGLVPTKGARVQVRQGHTVTYDLDSDRAIRFIHVAGVLTFAADRNTRLDVGLIKIEPSEIASEDGFDCDAHPAQVDLALPTPALEVGTQERPIGALWKATIRLVWFEGLDRQTCPAIVCCGGRMEIHGAPMRRTWLKLGQTAKKGDRSLLLAEPVEGWRVGDQHHRDGDPDAQQRSRTRHAQARRQGKAGIHRRADNHRLERPIIDPGSAVGPDS